MIKSIVLFSLLALCQISTAAQPLLIAGKTALYQRVLSIPTAQLHLSPGSKASQDITPFTSFYVYQRTEYQEENWLQVDTSRHGATAGWLKQKDSLEWNQGLTAVFKNPAGRDRALLFKDKQSIKSLVASKDAQQYRQLYEQAARGRLAKNSSVIAIQPATYTDIQKDFYLVPIRDHEDIYLQDEQARILKISSVPLTAKPAPKPKIKVVADATSKQSNAGLVFAIDATLSMDEYIDRTQEAVMKIYDKLGDSGVLGQVNFGLVAFRDNLQQTPELEYLSKTVVTLEQGRDPGKFLKQVNDLSAAAVSSNSFREDAYAGVKKAIEEMDWRAYQARYIILITDAGAREGDDPLSSTGMGTKELRQMAQDKGIALFVLHLLTPSAMADHQFAEAQYRQLSEFPGIGSLYYGVPTGDVTEFGQVLDALASQITDQVQQGGTSEPAPAPAATPAQNPQLAALQAKVSRLGYALQMQYLQKTDGQLPTVFDAWILDKDFNDPDRSMLDVRVLLSRDQLSDLNDILKQVLNTAEEGLLSPQNFLDELKSLSATISRDPEQLGATTATTAGKGNSLAELGFMREYTEDLPYTSEVMNLSLDDWQSWPAREQINFLNRLEEKISYYRALHDHTDLWVSLDQGPVDGDSVFPIPLEMLP